jgi:hypothetical protein
VVGLVVGGWGEIEIKAKLSPAEAGVWAELGNLLSVKIQKHRSNTFGEILF